MDWTEPIDYYPDHILLTELVQHCSFVAGKTFSIFLLFILFFVSISTHHRLELYFLNQPLLPSLFYTHLKPLYDLLYRYVSLVTNLLLLLYKTNAADQIPKARNHFSARVLLLKHFLVFTWFILLIFKVYTSPYAVKL